MKVLRVFLIYCSAILIIFVINLCFCAEFVTAQDEKLEVEEPRLDGEEKHIGHARHGSSSRHRARVRYSTSYRVPPELLVRKGGLILVDKQRLFNSGSVLLASPLRHLVEKDTDPDNLAVCEGPTTGNGSTSKKTQLFKYFACPLKIRDSRLKNFNDIDDPDEESYCCGKAPNQTCCDKETFYELYGHPVPSSPIVIVVSAACGLAVLILLSGVLVCVKLRAPSSSSGSRSKDPALNPLIVTGAPSIGIGSVYAANQQCSTDYTADDEIENRPTKSDLGSKD